MHIRQVIYIIYVSGQTTGEIQDQEGVGSGQEKLYTSLKYYVQNALEEVMSTILVNVCMRKVADFIHRKAANWDAIDEV